MTMQDAQVAEQPSASVKSHVSRSGYNDFVAGYLSYNGLKKLAGHFVTRRIRQDFVSYWHDRSVPVYMKHLLP